MVRSNQISIDGDACDFTCHSCNDRDFVTEHALLQHCRSSVHCGEWCNRCDWLFVSTEACSAHVRDAYNHWTCQFCSVDELDRDGLVTHLGVMHNYCYDCQLPFSDYDYHRVEKHHRCRECKKEYATENELIMHGQVHLPRQKECYGCYRRFTTDAVIVLHLESGSCPSGVTCDDIEKWAFQCSQHHTFTNDRNDDKPFRCPMCDRDFAFVSGLFQHIESPACSADYKNGIAQLRRRLVDCAVNRGSSEASY